MVELDPIRTVVVPTLGRAAARPARPGDRALPPAPRGRPDRGQRAVRRAHVAERQPDRRGCRRSCPTASARRSGWRPATPRSARPSASRFGRMFRVRRNDLRLLVGCGAAAAIAGAFNAPLTGAFYAFELVIGTYYPRHLRPGRGRRHRRGRGGQRARRQRRSISILQVPDARRSARLHPDPGARHGLRADRHRHHARRDPDRGAVPPQRRSGLAAPGDRRPRRRRAGAGDAGGAVLRPRRAGRGDRGALPADACRAAGGAEVDRLGDLDRLGVPRRPVLRLAVPGRAGRQGCSPARSRWSARRTRFRRWSAPWSA